MPSTSTSAASNFINRVLMTLRRHQPAIHAQPANRVQAFGGNFKLDRSGLMPGGSFKPGGS
jgi:hypothetical protein